MKPLKPDRNRLKNRVERGNDEGIGIGIIEIRAIPVLLPMLVNKVLRVIVGSRRTTAVPGSEGKTKAEASMWRGRGQRLDVRCSTRRACICSRGRVGCDVFAGVEATVWCDRDCDGEGVACRLLLCSVVHIPRHFLLGYA
jgi:hypothetical protein